MSVFNIALSPERADIVTDTLIYRDRIPVRLTASKVSVAPNGAFAVSVRGSVAEGERVAGVLFDFADCIDDVETVLACIKEGDLVDAEVNVVGWSAAEGRVIAIRQVWAARRPVRRMRLSDGVHIQPTGGPVRLPATGDADLLMRLTRAQKAASDKHDMGLCIGGAVHLTTVTAAGVVQEIADVLPGYDALALKFGDPNASEVARFLNGNRRHAA